jgi:anti-sigma regulatory factor (Ser/Thr protein kinase)
MAQTDFRHEALIYTDEEGFLAGAVPFVREALEAEEPTLVAVGPENTGLLKQELGPGAEEVRFAEIRRLGRNPARIIPFWRQFVDEHGGRSVRGVGEPAWPGRHTGEIDECRRHEHLLNVALSAAPAWSLLCPYDGRALDEEALRTVAASHLAVVFDFDLEGLARVRRIVEGAAQRAGLEDPHGTDLVLAANELAANSLVHGGGTGTLRVWREGDRIVVEVEDRGRIVEPLVSRIRPLPNQVGGRGLWLADQLCDLVQIRSGAWGTKVRLHMSTV